CQHAYGAPFTF
nr:immunoglobulin light chain junction region [Macaca mulatta]